MVRIGRPLFRRDLEYVAVRPFRLSADHDVERGETVSLPLHRMRRLWHRRRIGPKGDPWTEAMLNSEGWPSVRHHVAEDAEGPEEAEQEEVSASPQAVVDAINTSEGTRTIMDVIERNPPAIHRLLSHTQPIKTGSQWAIPDQTDELFESEEKAIAWLEWKQSQIEG